MRLLLSIRRTSFFAIQMTALFAAKTQARAQTVTLPLTRPDWVSSDGFTSIASVRVLSSGNVLVADPQDVAVRLVSPSGKIVRQIGRKGAGPGEYSEPYRLLTLPGDTTMLVDRGARRYLLIDSQGKVSATQTFPQSVGKGADEISASDSVGRLYYSARMASVVDSTPPVAPILRWRRGADRVDTVSMFHLEDPTVQNKAFKAGDVKGEMVFQTRMIFAPVEDWAVAPNGRVALIKPKPYRVDWIENSGKTTTGSPVSYTPVSVTNDDMKKQEPNGPPYRRNYAKVKAPFETESSVVDDQGNVWIPRFEAAKATTRRWDVFNSVGKLIGTVPVPSNRRIVSVNRKHAYLVFTDSDGLRWLERYTR